MLLLIDILVGSGAPVLSYLMRFILFTYLVRNSIRIPRTRRKGITLLLLILAVLLPILLIVKEKVILLKFILNFTLIYLTSIGNLDNIFPKKRNNIMLKVAESILFFGVFVATKLGFGEKSYTYLEYSGSGLFHAANDTGLVAAMLIFLNVLLTKNRYIDLVWYCAIYLPVCYTLSTKTALLSFVIGLVLLLFKLVSRKKYLVLVYPFLIYTLIVNIRDFVLNTDFNGVFKKTISYYEVGIGEARKFDRFIPEQIGFIGSDKILFIESDILDIIQLVGWLPSLVVVPALLVSLLVLMSGLKGVQLALFGLVILHGFIAGHVFLSTQVTMIFVLALHHLKTYNRYEQDAYNICTPRA